MKKSKKLLCLLFVTLMFLTFSVTAFASNTTNSDAIIIEVATDKAEYKTTGVAEITATITNVSGTDIQNVTAQAVFNDLAPAGKRTSQTNKSVDVLKSGDSFSFTYKATLDKDEHDLNIFQKIILWFVRLFNGGYTSNNNSINVVAENVTEIDFGKFTAENVVEVGHEAVNSDNDTNNQDNWIWGVDTAHVVSTDEYGNGYVDNLILIQFETTDKNIIDRVVDSINGTVIGFSNYEYQVQIESADLEKIKEICTDVSKMDGVWIAWPYYTARVGPDTIANDPWQDTFQGTLGVDWDENNPNGLNWWMETIQAPSAWNYNERFSNIKIGVVDGGFDTNHEDLEITVLNNNENSFEDHGTHVAGIIGATANNYTGITGIVWNKELYGVDIEKSNEQSEYLSMPDAFLGIEMLLEKGCKVINLSWGGLTDSNFDDIYEWGSYTANKILLWQEDMQRDDFIIVDSAGNKASDSARGMYFCSITDEVLDRYYSENKKELNSKGYTKEQIYDVYNHFIIVGAVEQTSSGYQMTDFSNYGSYVNISAPGKDIFSTVVMGGTDGNYANMPGTSMAAPIVTGVTSLVWSVNPDFSAKEVKNIVCSSYNKTADPYHYPTDVNVYPIVNAKLAVEEAIRRTDKLGTATGRFVDIKTGETVKNVTMECIKYIGDLNNYSLTDFNINASDGTFNCKMYEGDYEYKIYADGYVQEHNIILNIETEKCDEKGNINLIPTNSEDSDSGEDNNDNDESGESGDTEERTVTASGECGADGDNVTWVLYSDGELVISGNGAMIDDMSKSNLKPWDSIDHLITTLTIENGVTSISNWAFSHCDNLQDLSLGNTIKEIGNNAFYSCDNLPSTIIIPDNVTKIGSHAFDQYHHTIKNFVLGKNLKKIGSSAIDLFYEDINIYFNGSLTDWCNINKGDGKTNTGWLSTAGGYYNLYIGDSLVTSVTIPEEITEVNDFAFSRCISITSVNIPENVTVIGANAFNACRNLEYVQLSRGIREIRSQAFSYTAITEITIPNTIETMNEGNGYGCFRDAKNLKKVVFEEGLKKIPDYALYDSDGVNLICDVTIPSTVEIIGQGAFNGCSNLKSITIPNSVTNISKDAFRNCTNIESITIPNSVTSIGDYAFADCDSLTSIEIPHTVASIGDFTFEYCDNLTNIEISDNVTSIGRGAFSATAYYENSDNWENNVLYIGNHLIKASSNISGSYTIKPQTKTIADYAFYELHYEYNITNIIIPNTVTTIGDGSFYGCNLVSISIPKSVKVIDNDAFEFCFNLEKVYYSGTEEEWEAISIGSSNEYLTNATIHYNS